MDDLNEAITLIEQLGGGDFEGPKPEALVEQAERSLGVVFPPSYREFLLRLGCGDVEGLEFLGLIHDDFENSGHPDAVWATHRARSQGLGHDLVLVHASGEGTYFAVDTAVRDARGESPVVAWYVDGSVEPAAVDFGAFLLGELRAATTE